MSDIVIKVENLSKQYRLGSIGTGSLAHDLNRTWHLIRGKEDPYLKIGETNDRTQKGNSEYIWALQDINFHVKQGEVLGIIGRNGAGKSTLLKILSRTTTPTTGSVKIKGRVASLLEVGTGFHPELSGRENIFLNGAILGMTKQEIKSKFDEIVDFSGIERYIDTPVKRYSSGMYIRLAFGVAAHLESEILIVDEVLAVGDAEFQKKCLGKMKDVSEGEGRTVLFVSHNMAAVRQLCHTGLLLNNGKIEFEGYSANVIKNYFHNGYESTERPLVNSYRNYDIENAPIVIESVFTLDHENDIPKIPMFMEPEIIVRVKAHQEILNANVSISIYNSDGINVGIAFSWDDSFYLSLPVRGIYHIHFKLKNATLVPGQYFIGVGLNQSDRSKAWDGISYYPVFNIENQNNIEEYAHRSWGVNHFVDNDWSVKKINI
jgi:lipopolysaccharide transport system ATP-binding protein